MHAAMTMRPWHKAFHFISISVWEHFFKDANECNIFERLHLTLFEESVTNRFVICIITPYHKD